MIDKFIGKNVIIEMNGSTKYWIEIAGTMLGHHEGNQFFIGNYTKYFCRRDEFGEIEKKVDENGSFIMIQRQQCSNIRTKDEVTVDVKGVTMKLKVGK